MTREIVREFSPVAGARIDPRPGDPALGHQQRVIVKTPYGDFSALVRESRGGLDYGALYVESVRRIGGAQ